MIDSDLFVPTMWFHVQSFNLGKITKTKFGYATCINDEKEVCGSILLKEKQMLIVGPDVQVKSQLNWQLEESIENTKKSISYGELVQLVVDVLELGMVVFSKLAMVARDSQPKLERLSVCPMFTATRPEVVGLPRIQILKNTGHVKVLGPLVTVLITIKLISHVQVSNMDKGLQKEKTTLGNYGPNKKLKENGGDGLDSLGHSLSLKANEVILLEHTGPGYGKSIKNEFAWEIPREIIKIYQVISGVLQPVCQIIYIRSNGSEWGIVLQSSHVCGGRTNFFPDRNSSYS